MQWALLRRLKPLLRVCLVLALASCAQQAQVPPKARVQPGVHTVEPADQWAFAEDEDEMDPLVAAFDPLTGAGESEQIDAQFRGRDRKAAKTSISSARLEEFSSLEELVQTLAADDDMRNHNPEITRASTSQRVEEEDRNVRVPAFICAIKYEADQDWHIIGSSDSECEGLFFNFEVSGLPRSNSPAHDTLLTVRQDLAEILDHDLPGPGSYHKYKGNGPIPVIIQGSLFYDVDHAPGVVGPATMKPETAWEIHPVTQISLDQ